MVRFLFVLWWWSIEAMEGGHYYVIFNLNVIGVPHFCPVIFISIVVKFKCLKVFWAHVASALSRIKLHQWLGRIGHVIGIIFLAYMIIMWSMVDFCIDTIFYHYMCNFGLYLMSLYRSILMVCHVSLISVDIIRGHTSEGVLLKLVKIILKSH